MMKYIYIYIDTKERVRERYPQYERTCEALIMSIFIEPTVKIQCAPT